MLVGIHVNSKGSIQPFTQKYIAILEHNNIDHVMMNIQDPEFWDIYSGINAFIYQIGQTSDVLQLSASFLPILQHLTKIPVYPNFETSWHFDDKIKQEYLARYCALPFVQAYVFWDKEEARMWLRQSSYPVVFKLKGGAGSTNVVLIKKYRQAVRLVNAAFSRGLRDSKLNASWKVKYFPVNKYIRNNLIHAKKIIMSEDSTPYWALNKNYVYFQDFLPDNPYDTRVTVIGNRAFAFRRFNRKSDFRASGSGHINYDQDKIDLEAVRMALAISHRCNFQSMAYDFLYDGTTPKICEISYTYQDLAVYNCPGFWDDQLVWHEGHYMPQLFILEDLLGLKLNQPDWKI